MHWHEHVIDMLLPTRCLNCGKARGEKSPFRRLCSPCGTALPTTLWPLATAPQFTRCAWALAPYQGRAGELIRLIKYGRHPGLLEEVASHFAQSFNASFPKVDVVTWVPSTPQTTRRRGFTVSEQLAQAIGRKLDRPVRTLLRSQAGPQIAGLRPEQRHSAARDRFKTTTDIVPRTVLLVDDVMTSGASLSRCALCLIHVGAAQVYAATFANAGP